MVEAKRVQVLSDGRIRLTVRDSVFEGIREARCIGNVSYVHRGDLNNELKLMGHSGGVDAAICLQVGIAETLSEEVMHLPTLEIAALPNEQVVFKTYGGSPPVQVRAGMPLPSIVRQWLESVFPGHDASHQLRAAIETACDDISRLLDEVEYLRSTNVELHRRLGEVESELAQVQLVRDALIAELRKRSGPNPKSSKLLASAATVLLAVIGGAAGGASQQLVAEAMADEPSAAPVVQIDVGDAIEACEKVVNLSDEM